MPRQKSKPSPLNWAHELREVLSAKTRQPKGEGWMTAEQFCEVLDISRGTALQYLRRGMESGHIEMYRGTAISSAGIRIQTWYRPKTKNSTYSL
jgi:prophage antirepressor-like protein